MLTDSFHGKKSTTGDDTDHAGPTSGPAPQEIPAGLGPPASDTARTHKKFENVSAQFAQSVRATVNDIAKREGLSDTEIQDMVDKAMRTMGVYGGPRVVEAGD